MLHRRWSDEERRWILCDGTRIVLSLSRAEIFAFDLLDALVSLGVILVVAPTESIG